MKYSIGDVLFTSKSPIGFLKGEITVKVKGMDTKTKAYCVEDILRRWQDKGVWIVKEKDLRVTSMFKEEPKKLIVYVVELHVDDIQQGFAYLGESLKDAECWIKKHGQEWCGGGLDANVYYTIVGQAIGGDPMVCESFGQYKLDCTKGRNPPEGITPGE